MPQTLLLVHRRLTGAEGGVSVKDAAMDVNELTPDALESFIAGFAAH